MDNYWRDVANYLRTLEHFRGHRITGTLTPKQVEDIVRDASKKTKPGTPSDHIPGTTYGFGTAR